jgi:hypothetical protein
VVIAEAIIGLGMIYFIIQYILTGQSVIGYLALLTGALVVILVPSIAPRKLEFFEDHVRISRGKYVEDFPYSAIESSRLILRPLGPWIGLKFRNGLDKRLLIRGERDEMRISGYAKPSTAGTYLWNWLKERTPAGTDAKP